MKQQATKYLSNRVLKLNIGFMLDGQSRTKDMELDLPRVQVSEDLTLNYVRGTVRASRTKEGILIQGSLTVGVSGECYRCLNELERSIQIELEELFATSNELAIEVAEFRVLDDGQLDLAPLVRAETLIQIARGLRCEDHDACNQRMKNLEDEAGIDHIDPRMAKLKELLQSDQDK